MGLAQGILTPERLAAMQRIADAEREAMIAGTREIDRICKLLDANSEQEKSHNQLAPTVAECVATPPPQHDDET